MKKLDVSENTCYVYVFFNPATNKFVYISRSDAYCLYSNIREKNHLTTNKKSGNYKVYLTPIHFAYFCLASYSGSIRQYWN